MIARGRHPPIGLRVAFRGGAARPGPRPARSRWGLARLLFALSLVVLLGAAAVVGLWIRQAGLGGARDRRRPGSDARPPSTAPPINPRAGASSPALAQGDRERGGDGLLPSEQTPIQVFFTADGAFLRAEVIELPRSATPHERLRVALQELLRGPTSDKLRSAVPPGVRLRAMFLREQEAILDFSPDLAARPLGGPRAELLCAYAIVQTVVQNVESVKTVRIMIDGQTPQTLWGDVDLASGLTGDSSWVQR